MPTYRYHIEGSAAQEQTWQTDGTITVKNAGQFSEAFVLSTKEAFFKLTNGRAIYGKPGVGCHGPYQIVRFLLELQEG